MSDLSKELTLERTIAGFREKMTELKLPLKRINWHSNWLFKNLPMYHVNDWEQVVKRKIKSIKDNL